MIQDVTTEIVKTSTNRELVGREIEILKELYGLIWMEAIYDFETPETQTYARKLLPLISELKDLLGFMK